LKRSRGILPPPDPRIQLTAPARVFQQVRDPIRDKVVFMERYRYRIAGLHVASALELSGVAVSDGSGAADVRIRYGSVDATGLIQGDARTAWRAGPDAYVLAVKGVGGYRVTAGNTIEVDPVQGAQLSDLSLFLLGSAFGALWHQHGMLALHASAVMTDAGAMAFAGPSQTGKSTLAAYLTRRGHPLVTDDVAVVSRDASGGSRIWPGPGRIKLWRDGIERLGHDTEEFARAGGSRDKYHMPVGTADAQGHDAPVPLARLYVVSNADSLGIRKLSGLESVEAVAAQTYREQFVVPMGLGAGHFRLCAETARSIEVKQLDRPRGFERMEEVLDRLESDWTD
jgi:hypothetical protein